LVLVRPAHDLDDITFQFGLAQVAKLDRQQVAMHPQHRRQANGEMNVGAALIGAEFQESVDAGHMEMQFATEAWLRPMSI